MLQDATLPDIIKLGYDVESSDIILMTQAFHARILIRLQQLQRKPWKNRRSINELNKIRNIIEHDAVRIIDEAHLNGTDYIYITAAGDRAYLNPGQINGYIAFFENNF